MVASKSSSSRRAVAAEGGAEFKPTIPQVLTAVRSLCADQLRPVGRLILKRLREHAATEAAKAQGLDDVDVDSVPKIDPKQLRRLCEGCKDLRVVPEEGKEYSALLAGRNLLFVDVSSSVDVYPLQLWAELEAFVLRPGGGALPASRYDCAKVLMKQQLPCLRGYSLAKVCHIVQLSVSQKLILGYQNGELVPYHASKQREKELYAMHQQVFSDGATGEVKPLRVVQSWEEARACLQMLLAEARGEVMLSAVKRLFKTLFQVDLSETVLGHRRLFELLQDPRMQDICGVCGHHSGQLMVYAVDGTCNATVQHVVAPLAASVASTAVPALFLSTTPTAPPIAGGAPFKQEHAGIEDWQCVSPGASPRGSLCSWNMDAREPVEKIQKAMAWNSDAQLARKDSRSECSSTTAESFLTGERDDDLLSVCTPVKNTFIQFSLEEADGLRSGSARRRTQSV